MSYRVEDVEERLRLGEDSRWEFKQVTFAGDRPREPKRDDLADEIAAFANGNGGLLLCSVSDSGEAKDMSREELVALDSHLVEAATDSITPPVRIETHHMQLTTGERILLVVIPRGHAQHDSPGGCFLRVGSTKRLVAPEERLRLAMGRGQSHVVPYDRQPVPETGFSTLVEELWRPLITTESANRPERALRQVSLLAEDRTGTLRATPTGLLLCTRTPERWLPNAVITATAYRGTDRTSDQLDAKSITGPLNRQIADAVSFVAVFSKVGARKVPGRINMPQYSERAVFEAVVNAVAHRDYTMRGSRIRISVFEGRLEIQSPGVLPNGMTVADMLSSVATRNETLVSRLESIEAAGIPGSGGRQHLMERRGDGVRIIRRETRALCGKDPEYRLIGTRDLLLTIPAAPYQRNPGAATVRVRVDDQPLPDADLLLLYPNKTWERVTTGHDGEGHAALYTTELPMRVWVAAPGYAAHCGDDWVPQEGPLTVNLERLAKGGAVVFPEAMGEVPGLMGQLNPIRDTHDRTYLYGNRLSINKGKQQPVNFLLGEDLRVTDSRGEERWVRIIDTTGRSALVEYRLAEPTGSEAP